MIGKTTMPFIDTTFVDGYADGPHITEVQTGIANQGLYGDEDYVLSTGKRAEAQVLTNNSIRILDGVYVIQGRRDVIKANDYDDVVIENGAQGMNRNDIIVRRYVKEQESEIEKTSYAVVKGNPTQGEATDPTIEVGDIRSGALIHDMALYRVKIEGLNIVKVEPLFKMLMNMAELKEKVAELNSKTSSIEDALGDLLGRYAVPINHLPSERMSYLFHAESILPFSNGVEIPTYSKGIFITNGGKDGCLFSVTPQQKLVVGFRNEGTWYGRIV